MHERDKDMIAPLWARINTTNSTITASDGTVCRYSLDKTRRWNIGLRRHVSELNGEIRVHSPGESRSIAVECWSDAIMQAERWRINA